MKRFQVIMQKAMGDAMKASPEGVLTGVHFIDGDQAACEGALAAGCRFVAGYPITPSTEVVERFAARIPVVGGMFIQMEDEIASSIAIQGAVWGGAKVMTVTSGPGLSLMMEHIGMAVMAEVPMVIIDVQRGGPSTGLPTLPAQADMMQIKWGSHGDYQIIALSPNSPQECFDLMIKAFNLSETYRCPVFFMMDEVVGHMVERVEILPADQIDVTPRRFTDKTPEEYVAYRPGADLVPDIVKAGDGYHIHVTGLTHDERGYPAMNAPTQDALVRRLSDKILKNVEKISDVRLEDCDDADIIVVSYGITSRVASAAVEMARERGIKVGCARLVVCWPFPDHIIRALSQKAQAIVVVELNLGQMVREVQRVASSDAGVYFVDHAGGSVHEPERILDTIIQAAREVGLDVPTEEAGS